MAVLSNTFQKSLGLYCFCYHDVSIARRDVHSNMDVWTSVDRFREQMDYLCAEFEVIRPEDLPRLAGQKITKRYALITFDDGFKGVVQHALPIMRSLGIRGIVFYNQSLVSSGFPLWPMVLRYVEKTGLQESLFKYLYAAGLIGSVVPRNLRKWIHSHYSFALQFGVEQFAMQEFPDLFLDLFMGVDDLKMLGKEGWCIGNHGYHHARMAGLSRREQRFELQLSLEAARQQNITMSGGWAYPFGKRSDASQSASRAVRSYMGRCPVFLCDGRVNRKVRLSTLHRICVKDDSVRALKDIVYHAR